MRIAQAVRASPHSRRASSTDDRQVVTPLVAVDLKDHRIARLTVDADLRLRTRRATWPASELSAERWPGTSADPLAPRTQLSSFPEGVCQARTVLALTTYITPSSDGWAPCLSVLRSRSPHARSESRLYDFDRTV